MQGSGAAWAHFIQMQSTTANATASQIIGVSLERVM